MTGNKDAGIVIQERDRRLLRELALMRVVDREQAKLAAGFNSTTRVNHRLLVLTRAGLLRRFFLGTSGGGRKALYALSPKGALLVDVPLRGPRRKTDELLVADFFVVHQLYINEIYCAVKFQAIPVPQAQFARWLTFNEPLAPARSLIPDGYFEVLTEQRTVCAFLEVDLSHEGLKVWQGKVEAYLRYAASGEFQRVSRQPQFRVLVVTNSERRLYSLRKFIAGITDKVFWFTSFDLVSRNGLWSSIWFRPSGDQPQSLM